MMEVAERDRVYPSARVFCNVQLLHFLQMSKFRPYDDSKDFVDMELKQDPETVLALFKALPESPSRDEYESFVSQVFENAEAGGMTNAHKAVPLDYTDDPPKFLSELNVSNDMVVEYISDLKRRWCDLCRDFYARDSSPIPSTRSSLIRLPHPFFISGGRFREAYYWDTLWIVKGLVASDMMDSAKGAVRNLLHLVDDIGFVPNGNRVYYLNRSQPPVLAPSVRVICGALESTAEKVEWLEETVPLIGKEYATFMKRHALCEIYPDGPHSDSPLAVYRARTEDPRPESYKEDVTSSTTLKEKLSEDEDGEQRTKELYMHLASAAESGWDFSSRWFSGCSEGESLVDLRTSDIVPTCLNSVLMRVENDLSYFHRFLDEHSNGGSERGGENDRCSEGHADPDHHSKMAKHYAALAVERKTCMNKLLWNADEGFWYDYDLKCKKQTGIVSCGGLFPLWAGAWDDDWDCSAAKRFAKKVTSLLHPGGLAATAQDSEEQWDYPNCWPPLVDIAVEGLLGLGRTFPTCGADGVHVANAFLRSSFKGWINDKVMHEKYDCRDQEGKRGAGGEYEPQTGFGWTNGTILYLCKEFPECLESLCETA